MGDKCDICGAESDDFYSLVCKECVAALSRVRAEGYRAGAEAMRERAAREVFDFLAAKAGNEPTAALDDRIRALPLDPPEET